MRFAALSPTADADADALTTVDALAAHVSPISPALHLHTYTEDMPLLAKIVSVWGGLLFSTSLCPNASMVMTVDVRDKTLLFTVR